MFGSVGVLPALGMLSSSLGSGGGTPGVGFTMMSGLLNTMIRPKDAAAGFDNVLGPNSLSPFGTLQGGPNVESVGQLAGYIGQEYAAMGLPVPSPTFSGQYFGNAGYDFASNGVTYGSSGNAAASGDFRQGVTQTNLSGDLNAYGQSFATFGGSFSEGYTPQSYATFGSSMAPYSQSVAPMLTPYSTGYPQQYNSAANLYGYQSGSYSVNQPPSNPALLNINEGGPSLAQSIVGSNEGASAPSAEGKDESAAAAEE